jgi:hypothetical protein
MYYGRLDLHDFLREHMSNGYFTSDYGTRKDCLASLLISPLQPKFRSHWSGLCICHHNASGINLTINNRLILAFGPCCELVMLDLLDSPFHIQFPFFLPSLSERNPLLAANPN